MIKLTKNNYKALLYGSAFFSTGGGFTFTEQVQRVLKLINHCKEIKIFDLNEFDDDDLILTVYEVAKAGDPIKTNIRGLLNKALKEFSKRSIFPKGIFLGETGVESLFIDVSTKSSLKLIDADCTGGRAVPNVSIDNFILEGYQLPEPIIAINYKSTIRIFEDSSNIQEKLDEFYKEFNQPLIVFDHLCKVSTAKKVLTLDVLKRDIKVGNLIINNKSPLIFLDEAKDWEGAIEDIVYYNSDRYNYGKIVITTMNNNIFNIFFKNEYLKLQLYDNNLDMKEYNAPKLITLTDKNYKAINSSELKRGDIVKVIVHNPEKRWQSSYAETLFSNI